MSFRKHQLRGALFSSALALLCGASAYAANINVAAPGAGGYNSEYGSDYGVGRAIRLNKRQPISVIGLYAKTVGGTPQPWLGLRFGDALAQRLDELMGRAPSRVEIARQLLNGNLRPHGVGSGSQRQLSSGAQRALNILRGRKTDENVNGVELISTARGNSSGAPFSLALFGDVTLNGTLTRPNSALTISVRVARYNTAFSEAVTPIITLRASVDEWAQLPSRTALAVLDALSVQLNEDERVALLRDASPLMPSATAPRLAAEQSLGEAITAAIEAQWMLAQAQRVTTVTERRALLAKATAQATRSLGNLRRLSAAPWGAKPSGAKLSGTSEFERGAFAEMKRSAQSWIAPTQATVRSSQLMLQSFKAPAWQASSRHRAQPRSSTPRRNR